MTEINSFCSQYSNVIVWSDTVVERMLVDPQDIKNQNSGIVLAGVVISVTNANLPAEVKTKCKLKIIMTKTVPVMLRKLSTYKCKVGLYVNSNFTLF